MKESKNTQTFEVRMARLQEIVTALEDGALPLEKGVALYKEGMELSRACRLQLEKARNDIRIYTEGALRPFQPEEDGEGDENSDESEVD